MKLVKLAIDKLHGYYNYDVEFNSDVTFIYGENGCGKTTILNITAAIITGQLFKLFDYDFQQIELVYALAKNIDHQKSISIKPNEHGLAINFEGEKHILKKISMRDSEHSYEKRDVAVYYFERNDFLSHIKRKFNYVYLPLSRATRIYETSLDEDIYFVRRYPKASFSSFDDKMTDVAMRQLEELILKKHREITAHLSHLSDKFRNDVLKVLLEVNNPQLPLEVTKFGQSNIDDFEKTKEQYITILNELQVVNSNQLEEHINAFSQLVAPIVDAKKGAAPVSLEVFMRYQEVSRIARMIDIAEDYEKKKSKAREPLEIFLTTMNDFIGDGVEKKELKIDPIGKVYFTTKHHKAPISIQALSSGEKQLLTFYANLLFNVDSGRAGIFIVDEPELSLHLSWQKSFVEKTLEINKNIQLIFATHAPEIVGTRRNKMYKLEKEYSANERKD